MKVQAFILLSIFGSLFSCSTAENIKSLPEKPNIIYILADDLGYGDLGCYGQKIIRTPHIDKLAGEGMIFSQHYSGSTVCAPSRSSLMTGLHTGHTFIRGNRKVQPEGQWPLSGQAVTVAELLQKAGYKTGAFGKWGLGYPGSEGDPNNQGFDEFYGYNCQRIAHHYYPYHIWHNQKKVVLEKNAGKEAGDYAHDKIHAKALDFIGENKDRPFFLFLPYLIPHAELLVPDDSIFQSYSGKLQERRPYKGVDDGPKFRLGPYGSVERPRASFASMVTRLDLYVGQVVEKVEELGLTDKTLIIFTSDNGPHIEGGADPRFFDSNGLLTGYKRDLFEGGIRVPMIARWPGVIDPQTSTDHISAFWDVMPTVCELTGIKTPDETDGISFVPTLVGEAQKAHRYLYWEFHEMGGRQAVRLGNWKGVKYDIFTDPKSRIKLYDVSKDVSERIDIANLNPDIVKQIEGIMWEAHHRSDEFPFPWEK